MRNSSGERAEFARIVLNRLAFGPSAADLRTLGEFDFEHHVERQLHPDSIPDAECERRLAAAKLPTLTKSLRQLWAEHRVAADELKDAKNDPSPTPSPDANASGSYKGGDAERPRKPEDEQKLRHQPARETEIAAWIRAVYSERQLFETLVDFWHNHFNVFAWDNSTAPVFVHYDRDVIRRHALGNFRDLLEDVAKSPAMLFYLDNFVNQSGNPNENYARELFELHTLGAENYLGTRDRKRVPGFAAGSPTGYVDGDVYEAARCFTGWRVDANQKDATNTGEFAYHDPWHDRFQKVVLGHGLPEYQPPMKDGLTVLSLLAEHPGTARFVSRKLCRRLVCDEPTPTLVDRVAKVFRREHRAPDQLRKVVHAVVHSPEFRATRRAKLKRPFEAVAGMLRATGAEFHPTEAFLNNYQRAGQRLFAWRSPDGYPDIHERWGGTTPMLERWRLANQLLTARLDGVDVPTSRFDERSAQDPAKLAHELSERLLGAPLAPERLAAVASFLRADPKGEERLRGAAALVLMSPEFQWR